MKRIQPARLVALTLLVVLLAGPLPANGWAQGTPPPAAPGESGAAAAQADGLSAVGSVAPEARPAAIRTGTGTLREAWDLLLDRFVDPLDPAALALAADEALRATAGERGAPPMDALAVSGERASVWAG